MSQFAVARGLDNLKAYSARVSCAVRVGEAQGVHIVQVRAADVGAPTSIHPSGGAGGAGTIPAKSGGLSSVMRDPYFRVMASGALRPGLPGMSSGGVPSAMHGLMGGLAQSQYNYTNLPSAQAYSRYLMQPQAYAMQPSLMAGAGSAGAPDMSMYHQHQALAGSGTLAAYAAAMARAQSSSAGAAGQLAGVSALWAAPGHFSAADAAAALEEGDGADEDAGDPEDALAKAYRDSL